MKKFIKKTGITKRAICLCLALAVLVASVFSLVISSFGQTITYDISPTRLGTSDTYYSYTADTKTLTISGTGNTPDFVNNASSIPWYEWTSDTVENVVVEEGITKIGNYMFYQMAAVNYSLPQGLKTIGKYAFSFNNKMTQIIIPYGVESIMLNAFASNYYLQSVSLPNTLKSIAQKAFYNCIALDNVVIPSSVSNIDAYAFNKCKALSNLKFQSLTQSTVIGNYAFQECDALKAITVPLNTTLGIRAYGYASASSTYTDVLMRVYENSDGHTYAVGNGIPYEFLDTIPIECGVNNDNAYTQDNLSTVYHYTFTPDTSEVYNLYSTGNCDLVGKLYENGTLIGESDDIAQDNRNFCISQSLQAGVTYDLYVNSVKMEGSYSVYAYPDDITGLEVLKGSISADINDSTVVDKNRVFSFSADRYADFLLKVSFGNGMQVLTPYQEYFAGYYIVSGDDQTANPYLCGEGIATLSLKGNTAEYPLIVSHYYEEKVVEPTVDDSGYTLHTCAICGDSYTDNEIEPTSYIVTGKCVLSENPYGKHDLDIPYSYATIKIGNRSYKVNSDGTWRIRTYTNCYAVFENEFGSNYTIYIDVEGNSSYDYGTVVLDGYDLNKDGYVNAKDYVVYRKVMYDELGEHYWDFGAEYLISHIKN